jgi:hypothetical protein
VPSRRRPEKSNHAGDDPGYADPSDRLPRVRTDSDRPSDASKSVDFTGATQTKPSRAGTVLPATCSAGETYLKIDAPAGQSVYVCLIGNTWSLQGSAIPGVTVYANTVLATDRTSLLWKALGGDIGGAPSAMKVTGIQGRAVSANAPTNGQTLVWNAGREPVATAIGNGRGICRLRPNRIGLLAIRRLFLSADFGNHHGFPGWRGH